MKDKKVGYVNIEIWVGQKRNILTSVNVNVENMTYTQVCQMIAEMEKIKNELVEGMIDYEVFYGKRKRI